ncbi:HD domain-containing protein [Myxococcota bacterium]|nr:HD domain-containing protein [Myxococcota bacterium]
MAAEGRGVGDELVGGTLSLGTGSREAIARDLAMRLAGASHSRRLYSTKGPIWERTLASLRERLDEVLASTDEGELTFALLADGLAVSGVPVLDPPSSVVRFIGVMKERDVEIISVRRGCEASELEALLSFLGADAADVAAMRADTWLAERGVTHVGIKHLRLMRGEGVESFRDVFWRGRRQLARELDRAGRDGVVSAGAVSELARSLVEVVLETKTPVATLLALRDRDDFTVVHSVNVGILAGAQASALGVAEAEAERIVFAALLHDLGKTKVPEQILSNRTGLSPREREVLDRHVVEGARIVLQTSPGDWLSAAVAAEHHLLPSEKKEEVLAVELCRIADVFDVVRTLRPFDDLRAMRGAIAFMLRRLGHRFNPFLLERFAALVGMFDAGDHARLDTGEIVRVAAPNLELPFHPVIEVLDRSTGRLPRGTSVDLARLAARTDAPKVVPTLPSRFADLEPEEIDALG